MRNNIKLLRSAFDVQVFDLAPEVAARYIGDRHECETLEIWKPNRQAATVEPGWTLRIQAPGAFLLPWSGDDWGSGHDMSSGHTALWVDYVNLPVPTDQEKPIHVTFFWTAEGRWEGRDYQVAMGRR